MPILVLGSHKAAPHTEVVNSFEQHLGTLGINARIEKHWLDSESTRQSDLLDQAAGGDFKAVLTLGVSAAKLAGEKITNTPIVAGLLLDADDLQTRKNVTGVLLEFAPEFQFQWIGKLLPGIRNVGVLYNPRKSQHRIDRAVAIAKSMGLNLLARQIEKPTDIPGALNDLVTKIDCLWGIPDPIVYNPQTAKHILLFSLQNGIPLIGLSESWVKAGAIFALNTNNEDIGAQCAEAMAEALRNKAASGGILEARSASYSLNLKTAEQLKINIPEGIIRGARELFR
ncbi:MAG: ABC transporter substrate binding protein [Syntrophobacteraceae bacterium]